jgi:phosphoribosylformimino-5-aminoimidazole carboxamide ribotide isomerase
MGDFKVIPAIDLMDGRCVRLLQGDYQRRFNYPHDPVELAQAFLKAGLSWLHVVDLDGAKGGRPRNLVTVAAIAQTGIQIEMGGGIRTEAHIQQALDAGVREVILGSVLLGQKEQIPGWIAGYRNQLVAGVDARQGLVAIHGWQNTTRKSALALVTWLEEIGFGRLIYTDITSDGTLGGPSLKQLQAVAQSTNLQVTASGGIGSADDIQAVKKLQAYGVTGAIVGKAFYEGRISVEELAAC